MRLDQELIHRKLCESRTEAQELIDQGVVLVDGIVCTKRTKQVDENVSIQVTERRKYVSRGGHKLEGVLHDYIGDDEKIAAFCNGKTVIDIGSSTGGFTDCILGYGVTHVDAIDVGTNQLHEKIRKDARVTVHENTDIRKYNSAVTYDIIVADLSFIPLENILDTIISRGHTESVFFLLIKPQFEVGKGNTKKGIVKDDSLINTILDKYCDLAKVYGLLEVAIFPSRIEGGDGNKEYFLCGVKA